ncbi:MAG: ATP-dependent DNA helicase [Thermoplasmata archaeon]
MSADASLAPPLFPYRLRQGQEGIVLATTALTRSGGALAIDAPAGFGKTVAVLAPLLAHAQAANHKILYLVRTRAQELQVLHEVRAISHRLESPILATTLHGRQSRCLLLADVAEMKGATAEEHGKLCADRKRATQRLFEEGIPFDRPPELPESPAVDLTDFEGCAFFARVLQADLDEMTERWSANPPSPQEFDGACHSQNICSYELAKRLAARARILVAPYSFFFHPHVRLRIFEWMGVAPEEVDIVLDEANNLPDQLRELASVSLPQESVRRARAEILDQGDFPLPDGPSALHFIEALQAEIDEILGALPSGEDVPLPPPTLEERLLERTGTDMEHLEAWLGALVQWGENLRDLRRQDRRLPRSWVHSVALTLLSWPKLEAPGYVKVVTRAPRRALEGYALDARPTAVAVKDCHLSVHLSQSLAPLEEYRDAMGLDPSTALLQIPSNFPFDRRRYVVDASFPLRPEDLLQDASALARWTDRLADHLQHLPSKTLVIFPSFELMERALVAGLSSALPPGAIIESRRLALGDLWRPVEGIRKKDERAGLILGVAGGRAVEGVDYSEENLEAVVLAGIPFPARSAKREALAAFLDTLAPGEGEIRAFRVPAERAIAQAIGRLIRSEHDRGLLVIMDPRGMEFDRLLEGVENLDYLPDVAARFFGGRAKFYYVTLPTAKGTAGTESERLKRGA